MPRPLNRRALLVLQAMQRLHQHNSDYLYTFKRIGNEVGPDVLKSDIRKTVRFLKRRGYVQYSQAFSEDDYFAAGSGHMITAEGILYLNNLELPK